jgi:hypothetical protein
MRGTCITCPKTHLSRGRKQQIQHTFVKTSAPCQHYKSGRNCTKSSKSPMKMGSSGTRHAAHAHGKRSDHRGIHRCWAAAHTTRFHCTHTHRVHCGQARSDDDCTRCFGRNRNLVTYENLLGHLDLVSPGFFARHPRVYQKGLAHRSKKSHHRTCGSWEWAAYYWTFCPVID